MKKLTLVLCFIAFSISAGELRTLTTTDTRTITTIIHYLKPYDVSELDANTIQNIYFSPYKKECFATIIKPEYSTVCSLFTKEQYKNTSRLTKGFTCDSVTDDELKQLYVSILNKDKEISFNIVKKILLKSNDINANIIWLGKDKFKRNTCYVYKLGFEHKGIVLFYPDNWNELISSGKDIRSLIYKDPTRVGWNPFVDKFVKIMIKYNKHVNFSKVYEQGKEVYVLKFK